MGKHGDARGQIMVEHFLLFAIVGMAMMIALRPGGFPKVVKEIHEQFFGAVVRANNFLN